MKDLLFINLGLWDAGAWAFTAFLLFYIGMILFVITVIINIKRGKASLKFTIPFYAISILFIWTIIPAIFDFCSVINYRSTTESIKYQKISIALSVLPWQKGAYYCQLSTDYFINNDSKNALLALDKARYYLKDYKYLNPLSELTYFMYQRYDEAIEISTAYRHYGMTSKLYIIKQDYENALKYANLYIEQSLQKASAKKNVYEAYATRGYIYKKLDKLEEAENDYKKALEYCKTVSDKNKAKELYNNPVSSVIERQQSMKKEHVIY